MGVDVPLGHGVFQPDQISVPQKLDLRQLLPLLGEHGDVLLVPLLDPELVVLVLVGVRGHLLLLGTHPLGIEMEMGVEVPASRPVVLEGDEGSVRDLSRHGRVVKDVSDQRGLERTGEMTITISTGKNLSR